MVLIEARGKINSLVHSAAKGVNLLAQVGIPNLESAH